MSVAPASGDRLPYGKLLVLAGAIFVSVSSEFLPTGLLPDIASDLRVSESRVGLLVSLFAFTVTITAAPLTVFTRRFSRKWLMVVLLGVFAVANLIAAVAPGYEVLAGARILGGLAHGLFWAVAGPYTALLVPPRQLARAMSVTTGGGSLAFILGVPLTAAIGHALGWRLAFATMAAIVVVFAVLVVVLLPPVSHRAARPAAQGSTPPPRDRSVVAVAIVAVSVLLVTVGHNLFYTYVAPWSIAVGGIDDDLVSSLLLIFGIAGAAGLLVAGVFGDRYPRAVVLVSVGGLAVSMVLVALFGHGFTATAITMFFWSAGFGGLPALFQTRNLHAASARIRDVAAAVITTAFNAAIGFGALFGGLVLDGVGIQAVPWVGAGIVLVGFVWILATDRARVAAHSDHRDPPAEPAPALPARDA